MIGPGWLCGVEVCSSECTTSLQKAGPSNYAFIRQSGVMLFFLLLLICFLLMLFILWKFFRVLFSNLQSLRVSILLYKEAFLLTQHNLLLFILFLKKVKFCHIYCQAWFGLRNINGWSGNSTIKQGMRMLNSFYFLNIHFL